MRHHINIIASNFGFDKKEFETFCKNQMKMDKHGLIEETEGFITTSTWYTDELIQAYKKHQKEIAPTIREANKELITINKMMELIKDNTLACEVSIGGVTIGLCNNEKVATALEHNKNEIIKFLSGEPNEWE